MKDRIRQIMESQHMTQQVFADFIGTTPATLSGIFNDRTRPTINIVEAIKKKIPNINTDWLLFGAGDMYQHSSTPKESSDTMLDGGGQQAQMSSDPMLDFSAISAPTPQNSSSAARFYNGVRNTHLENVREEVRIVDKQPRKVTEIRVYYDDQTWESFVPSKK